jgi:integrase/recombinase XerD
MLTELFPRTHSQYSSLPLFGASLDGFARWLHDRGFLRYRVRQYLRAARRIDQALRQRGDGAVGAITREALQACAPPSGRSRDDSNRATTARSLERYFEETGLLPAPPLDPPSRSCRLVAEYRRFLEDIRGLAPETVGEHVRTAALLLEHLGYEDQPSRLVSLSVRDIEDFVRTRGRRVSRATLQHEIAQLRSLLRFLAAQGETSPGLDGQIDTPRVYRLERLPRALPWQTVCSFLRCIDRSASRGLRDYAIFFLIATYGLRASEVVLLTLDDIDWRNGRICVRPSKTQTALLLPLTDEVATVLIDYLRRGRPALPCREVFLRCQAPGGRLGATAVGEAFKVWLRRSGLSIPSQGPHCLRHSYAVHLLRQGTPLKTIGDVLGHHSAESTCVYLRLSIEDLRDVALPLPEDRAWEVRP